MNKVIKHSIPLVVFTLLCLALGIWAYPQLPDKVPSHWNVRGEVDGYSGKTFAVFFFPIMILLMYGMFALLPLVDPKREKYQQFAGAYSFLRAVIILFLDAMYLITIFAGLGYGINIGLVVRLGVSILFILIGDQLGRVKQNWFVGIKTPWTLSSEENWRKTHRFGSKAMVLGGVLSLFTLPFDGPVAAAIYFTLIMAGALASIVYSYLIFRQSDR